MPAAGHYNHIALVLTFTPPITCYKATAKPPSPLPGPPDQALVLPLREVTGVDSLVRVHVPFYLSELSQIENRLGSCLSNSSTFIKEFQYITQTYSLTFNYVLTILTKNLLPEKCRRVWEQAGIHADNINQTDRAYPIRSKAVPDQDPQWKYDSAATWYFSQTCLLASQRKIA